MIEDPDTVINRVPQGSCGCGRTLDGQPSRVKARRPQRDIPPVKIQVSECPQHEVACGEFPAGNSPNVSDGPRIKAYAVGLIEGHCVRRRRTGEILGDHYGVSPSDGTLHSWILQASVRLNAAYEAGGEQIRSVEVAHFDESGMREGGKRHWLPVSSTDRAVDDTPHEKRGREGMEAAGILP